MKKRFLTYFSFLLTSFALPANSYAPALSIENFNKAGGRNEAGITTAMKAQAFETHSLGLFTEAGLDKANLDFTLFRKALVGYYNLQTRPGKIVKPVISIIDFSKSSRQKRLWVIDLKNKKLLFNTLVAHGRGTGNEFARYFSNEPNSFKSSLGFYVTSQTYFGKHGLSLKLNGLDKNFNTNAYDRAVVIHGADYVSESFIKQTGRLGRSLGCPALPIGETKKIIENIKDNSCLFIYAPDKKYTSRFLTETSAIDLFASQYFASKAI